MTVTARAKFNIGQVVYHRELGYRGLIFDADPIYNSDPEWYEQLSVARPPRDEPWYFVLVDGEAFSTYVAESNLIGAQGDVAPIEHPLMAEFFTREMAAGDRYEAITPLN